ncbi:MAG TPA: glucans biosynthesis glucosyltransferase MdoH [Opitutaceae bacterium]|nr:glucans biosynthesis glucosyltransferase MdoH [Opitutaceae bacterium]
MPNPTPKLFVTERLERRRVIKRRFVFFTTIFLLTSLAGWFMADLLWNSGTHPGRMSPIEWVVLVLFVVLFAHVATGFVHALFGFYVLNRGGDFCRVQRSLPSEDPHAPLAPTAVVMPVCNEDSSRVFEGLRVIYRSLEETGKLGNFDFFILSDTSDPNKWIQEELAWVELCKQVGGFGRIFYRKRRQGINKKSGNVADFLRRWGSRYRYFAVLDADSIMTGRSLVRMVQLMERNPTVGILQSVPRLIRGETLFARLQQFANRLYSSVFLAGLNYWQQGEGNFWGHNAVIRTAQFMEHCSLPDLPGTEPFGGRILSHDFVEAALMVRAGYSVWLAYDLDGSFEEGPPSVIDSAKRDRRWCQGNLQHSWLLFARGLRGASRVHLLMGIMGYVASPLWLFFLLLSTIHVLDQDLSGTTHSVGEIIFERWGVYFELPQTLALFGLTLVMLFVPKVLGVLVQWREEGRRPVYGGRLRMVVSAVIETLLSSLLAPINMMFHAKFVVFTLLGQGVGWVTQRRDAEGNDWREAILTHWGQTAFGLIWGISTYIRLPSFFWWLSPVLAGLVLSIPLSIFLGSSKIGAMTRRWGLFLFPEESAPPYELRRLEKNLAECYRHMRPIEELRDDYGLLQAVLDPYINALHVSLQRQRRPAAATRAYFLGLRERLLKDGPKRLSAREKRALLLDPESMTWLHRELWRRPQTELAEWWQLGVRQYNVLTAQPVTALYR